MTREANRPGEVKQAEGQAERDGDINALLARVDEDVADVERYSGDPGELEQFVMSYRFLAEEIRRLRDRNAKLEAVAERAVEFEAHRIGPVSYLETRETMLEVALRQALRAAGYLADEGTGEFP